MEGNRVDEVLSRLKANFARAMEIAGEIGEVVGSISPFEESIASGRNRVCVVLDLPQYIDRKRVVARPGSILAAVDLVTLNVVSLKVVEFARVDFYSQYGREEGLTPYPLQHDMRGLLTRPRVVAEPQLSFKYIDGSLRGGESANFVIEPHSPVVLPKPELMEELIGIKGDLVIGALTIGEEVVKIGDTIAKIKIPLEDLVYHMFVVGTTGSGKTSFIKNLLKLLLCRKNVAAVCIDYNGDYVQTILDPVWTAEVEEEFESELAENLYGGLGGLSKIRVLLPVTRYFIDKNKVDSLEKLAEVYYNYSLKRIVECFYKNKLKVYYSAEEGEGIIKLEVNVNGQSIERNVEVIPYALEFTKVRKEIGELYPYFTALAREGLLSLFTYILENSKKYDSKRHIDIAIRTRGSGGTQIISKDFEDNLRGFIEVIDYWYNKNMYDLASKVKLSVQTLGNIVRSLARLHEMGIFDVKIGDKSVSEPNISDIIKDDNTLVVLDLHALETISGVAKRAKRLLTLRVLKKILDWKIEREFEETPLTIVLVDEAHEFFPRRGAGEESEYIRYVSGALERIARLGRVRGLGLILSTHSPKDVHDAVLNLCNHKVVFRLDPSVVDELDLPRDFREFVTRASDRVGVLKSHALRLHYMTFKTSLPVLGHFKR